MSALHAETDPERSRWVLDALGPFGTFEGIVPPLFDAAVRILHPATDEAGEPLRWREVAERAGTVLHPLAQWDDLSRRDDRRFGAPRLGQLDLDELAAVADVLAGATATPERCSAAFWEGTGVLGTVAIVAVGARDGSEELPAWHGDDRATGREHPAVAAAESIALPQRESLLFSLDVRALTDPAWARESGFADATGAIVQTPIALWPDDRAWYLASEIDLDSTLIGGSEQLVDRILALADDGVIEALRLPAAVDLTSRGDRINGRA
jgi:hypothetical protein